jgi:MoxR-like ATPase
VCGLHSTVANHYRYIGYVTNSSGQLEFRDGLLVEALRKGHWIILDELNLAPSDVLEALNRLLDDNKELLIPETGELVKPAPGFTLFATQNPPGIYGGRKPLSRAFKNRFLELSVCDLPLSEVEEIVTLSCGIAPKFSTMLVMTMQELQIHRQKSTLFQGKYGSITTRDLIKWGRRKPGTAQEVAEEGFMLIAEKLRAADEKQLVADILNKVCKAQLDIAELYAEPVAPPAPAAGSKKGSREIATAAKSDRFALAEVQAQVRSGSVTVDGMQNIAVTATMRRMWELVNRALRQNEPVLLIGDTGCGKTTVCQLYSAHNHQRIRILNCHQSTETADIIGGLRPVRGRDAVRASLAADLITLVHALSAYLGLHTSSNAGDGSASPMRAAEVARDFPSIHAVSTALNAGDEAQSAARVQALEEGLLKIALDEINEVLNRMAQEDGTASPVKRTRGADSPSEAVSVVEKVADLRTVLQRAVASWQRCKALFEWQDGPLITAMKEGDVFVIDEINLAEDAVIERLNSVLESGRSITLAEKGGLSSEVIIAHPNFKLLATMNPGGDFGKRELSPALRSRFTEVWIPAATNPADIALIVKEILSLNTASMHGAGDEHSSTQIAEDLSVRLAYFMIEFMDWMNTQSSQWMINGIQISVREILAWAKFISQSAPKTAQDVLTAYIHGAFMIMLDGLGIGMSIPRERIRQLKVDCFAHLAQQCTSVADAGDVQWSASDFFLSTSSGAANERTAALMCKTPTHFSVGKFAIPWGPQKATDAKSSAADSEALVDKPQKEYVLNAQITSLNLGRILRAMQLPRAILLEGPPGVGKSSLIANLAALTGHTLVRINLSEHSELSDLLGTDLPASAVADSDEGGELTDTAAEGKRSASSGGAPNFKWCDGVFLTAMKQGHWVLLDELNLAPQSVLEGLNACFDHRQEVFLPDIGQTVTCPPSFRVFCAQNPMVEGGGRKGLPQSFLSRFSRVFVEAMTEDDLLEIVSLAFQQQEAAAQPAQPVDAEMEIDAAVTVPFELSTVPSELTAYIPHMVKFTQQLQRNIVESSVYGHTGGPWEFNLRDIFRWCELVLALLAQRNTLPQELQSTTDHLVSEAAYVLFVRRMRTADDRTRLCSDFEAVFGFPLCAVESPALHAAVRKGGPDGAAAFEFQVGFAALPVTLNPHYMHRNQPLCEAISSLLQFDNAQTMQAFAKSVESVAQCVSLQWPVLLVGAHGAGKHRVLRYLAAQTGHVIDHFAVSPSTDSTELLGSFEQVSAARHLNQGVAHLHDACVTILQCLLARSLSENDITLAELCAEVTGRFQKVHGDALRVTEANALNLDDGKALLEDIQALVDAVWRFVHQEGGDSAETVRRAVTKALQEVRTAVKLSHGADGSSGFEWVDGIIVRAVTQGKWLFIDNINLCSASVLDRLNSLLEPNGSLLLTECGDGRVVTPHPDFRIFFAMDPALGEISRAMRNRCVEIALLPTDSDNKWSMANVQLQQQLIPRELHDGLYGLCARLGFSALAAPARGSALLPHHLPKYQLFTRILEVTQINVHSGMVPALAAAAAVETVLPGFVARTALSLPSATATEADDSTVYSEASREVFAHGHVSQEVKVALDIIGDIQQGREVSRWVYRIIQQAEARATLPHNPVREFLQAVRSVVHLPAAEGETQLEQQLVPLDPEGQIVLALNLLVSLSASAEGENLDEGELTWQQNLLSELLGRVDLSAEYQFWLQLYHYNMSTMGPAPGTSPIVRRHIIAAVQFKRCLTLEQERLCTEAVRSLTDATVLQNASQPHSLSVWAVALAIRKGVIVVDSRELMVVQAVHQVQLAIDSVLQQFLRLVATVEYDAIDAAKVLALLQSVLLKRDALSGALCAASYSEGGSAQQIRQMLPWDEMSICTRWLKKTITLLANHLSLTSGVVAVHPLCEACTAALQELQRFDKTVGAYWHRAVMTEKLRLWKEGGHAAVPALASNWELLMQLRSVVDLLRDVGTRNLFTDTSVAVLPALTGYQSRRAVEMQREWLYLYCTFYWACTNEESAEAVVRSAKKRNVNIASLLVGLTSKFQEHHTATVLPDLLLLNDTECFDYDDGSSRGLGMQYTKYVHDRIAREREAAGEQSLCALVEPIVLRALLRISNALGTFLLTEAATDDAWRTLRGTAVTAIGLALRYTNIHPIQLRELQSLVWAVDAHLASADRTATTTVLRTLSRVYVVTLENRIFSAVAQSTANHLQALSFSYASPTLRLLLDANANSTGSVSTSSGGAEETQTHSVPWEQSLRAGYVRLLQAVSAEVAARHVDVQAVCPRYQSGGPALKLISSSTAAVTISSCVTARKRLYQLVRATVAASTQRDISLSSPPSHALALEEIQRLQLLKVYTLDVVRSCRDFYSAEMSAQIGTMTEASFNALKELNIAAHVKNSTISALFDRCLQPVLHFIAQAENTASAAPLAEIGAAWVRIGLLRVHLLLPTMPVDPAAKSAIKSRLLQAQNSDLQTQLVNAYQHNALSDGELLRSDIATEAAVFAARCADIERLNGSGIERPASAAPFVELYFEVKSSLDGVLAVDRVCHLLDSLVQPASAGDAKVVLREELAWQANALTVVQRMEQNYAPFEDIVSTVTAAVAHMSSGLRVVAVTVESGVSANHRHGAGVLVPEDPAANAFTAVVQYPYSINVSLQAAEPKSLEHSVSQPVSLLLGGVTAAVNRVVEALTAAKQDTSDGRSRTPDPSAVTTLTPHIVLLHALSRIEYLVGGGVTDLAAMYSVLQNTLDKFVEAYLKELDERRRKAAAKEALFRNRERVFESDDVKEEEAAYKEHFPDHLAAFKSLNLNGDNTAVLPSKAMGDDDEDEEGDTPVLAQTDEENAEDDHMMFDANTTSEVVSHHMRIVFSQLVQMAAEKHIIFDYGRASELSGSSVGAGSQLVARKQRLQQALNHSTIVTSKALDWAVRGAIAPNLDAQLRGAAIMNLALTARRCAAQDMLSNAPAAAMKKSSKRNKAADNAQPDRDLLLLLHDDSDDTAAEWKPKDFHKDPNPAEAIKATEILQNIFDRSSELLIQFPGNELLVQVCKVAAKISEFHLTTPLGKMLISLQLLLQKAEEWEMFAAKHVSLRAQMSELSGLIAHWRELELQSWETLLRGKEVAYAQTAALNWYTLMRMLNGQPIVQSDPTPVVDSPPTPVTVAWASLEEYAPAWLKAGYKRAAEAAVTTKPAEPETQEIVMAPKLRKRCPEMFEVATEQLMTESQYLAKIFTTLDGFLRTSVVGEFPTRLHLLRLFALQLQLECKVNTFSESQSSASAPATSEKAKRKARRSGVPGATAANPMLLLKARLANIVTGIWQYYDQFLPIVRNFQDLLKGPIQTKLKGEVKIGKWDQLNTYALIEYSEKIHRKLNKFLREYQGDVLDHPISAILRRELLDDFVTKAGELQSATAVPPVGAMCPALQPLGDGATGTTPEQLLQSPICSSEYFTVDRSSAAALGTLAGADSNLLTLYPRIFKVESYATRMRTYLTDALIPDHSKATTVVVREEKKPVTPVAPEGGSEETKDAAEEEAETDYNSFGTQVFQNKACFGLHGAVIAEDLCQEIFARVQSLRSEDVPKPIKQRAVRDLLSTLKDHGVSHLRSTVASELRENLYLFSMNAPLASETMSDLCYSIGHPKQTLDKAEAYYCKIVSEITQLRAQSESACSHDVSQRDVLTMLALSENLLAEEVKLRSAVGAALTDFKSLLSCTSALRNLQQTAQTAAEGVAQSTIDAAAQQNRILARIMLDNLVQTQTLLQYASEANAATNVEENPQLPVVAPAQSRRALQAVDTVISLVCKIADDAHTASSGNGAGLGVPGLCTVAPIGVVSCTASSTMETLQRHAKAVDEACSLLCDNVNARLMADLISADVVAPLLQRMQELRESVSQAYSANHLTSSVVNSTTASATPADALQAILGADGNDTNGLGALVSRCIDECLVSVQKLRSFADVKAIAANTSFAGCFGEKLLMSLVGDDSNNGEQATVAPALILKDSVTLSVTTLAACQLQKVTTALTQIQSALSARLDTATAAERLAASAVLSAIQPVVQLLAQAYCTLVDGLVMQYKSVGKLLYICVRIFRTLLSKGICAATVEEGEGEGGGDLSNMLFQDDVDGTGMGEGEGKKDVSDQIENEEQLLGLKDDVPKDSGGMCCSSRLCYF